ncbi:MAG: cytochrome c biogenesis protein ResB [Verrucomicrobiales bacterium]|nr:cytochrome c biogenesis protein ResB [Verrucomicrobiales bacterium]
MTDTESEIHKGSRKRKSLLAKLYDFFSGYLLAVILLTFLLALTYFGTMAQVELGLYEASEKYFESFFLTENIAGVPILLPGVYLVSVLLFLNLTLGAIVRSRKSWRRPGMLIAHGGILYILLAGFVAFHYTKEGNMLLYEPNGSDVRHQSDEIYNLTNWSIEVTKYDSDGKREFIHVIGPDQLGGAWNEGASRNFRNSEIPFQIKVSGYLRNIANGKGQLLGLLSEKGAKDEGVRIIEGYGVEAVPTNKSMEFNLPAAYVDIYVKVKSNEYASESVSSALIIGSGPMSPRPFTFSVNDEQWSVDLTRQRYTLPFAIELENFQKEDHPGTMRAREYSSDVIKIDTGRKVHISMNKPMRDAGFTLYQASWGPEGARPGDRLYTSLAVSYNPADQWPKYGTYVIAIGMTIHFVQKLFSYLKRSNRSRRREEDSQ